jgi:hypothetical protein
VGVGVGTTVAYGIAMDDGMTVGSCSGIVVAPGRGVDAEGVVRCSGGVGEDRSIVGIVLPACVEDEMESVMKDVAMIPTAIRQVITTTIRLHWKKCFVPTGPAYADVWMMALEFTVTASANRLRANA